SLNGIASFNFNILNSKIFANTWKVYKYNVNTQKYDQYVGANSEGQTFSTLNQANNVNRQKYYFIALKYKRSFGNNNFNGFFAYEQQEGRMFNLTGFRRDIVSAEKPFLNQASTLNQTTGGGATNTARRSY